MRNAHNTLNEEEEVRAGTASATGLNLFKCVYIQKKKGKGNTPKSYSLSSAE